MTMRAITIDGALTEAWTSQRLVVLLGSLIKRRAIHLRANQSSVAYIMCIIGLLHSADEIFAPYKGFVRVINHSDRSGQVSVWATDDSGMEVGPVTLSVGANKTAHFNSKDLEGGNTGKGLSNGIGSGQGDWWLDISSSLNIEAIAYMRTTDGFLTSMFESVPGIGNRYRVPVLNPGSNQDQVSQLVGCEFLFDAQST